MNPTTLICKAGEIRILSQYLEFHYHVKDPINFSKKKIKKLIIRILVYSL